MEITIHLNESATYSLTRQAEAREISPTEYAERLVDRVLSFLGTWDEPKKDIEIVFDKLSDNLAVFKQCRRTNRMPARSCWEYGAK